MHKVEAVRPQNEAVQYVETSSANKQDFIIKRTDQVMTKIDNCMDMIPLKTVRKWFRKQRRYEDAYAGRATTETY